MNGKMKKLRAIPNTKTGLACNKSLNPRIPP